MTMVGKYAGTFEIVDLDQVTLHMDDPTQEQALAARLAQIQKINDLTYAIADVAAPELLISNAAPVTADGATWYELDSLDIENDYELAYCVARDLLHHHPTQPNLVQVKERP
jgi:hypothetical protein